MGRETPNEALWVGRGWVGGGSALPASGCGPPPETLGVRGEGEGKFQGPPCPTWFPVSSEVLGDRAPEFPPDPAQQNTLVTPFPHNCLTVRTSLDQALSYPTEEGTQNHHLSTLSGISADFNQRSSIQTLSPRKVSTSHNLTWRATALGQVSLFAKAARELRAKPTAQSWPLMLSARSFYF